MSTIRNTLLYLPAQIISPAVQFFSIIAWTHLLKPVDMGSVTLVVSSQEVCFAIFVSWWSRYILRFINDFRAEPERGGFLKTEAVAVGVAILVQTIVVMALFASFFPLAKANLILAAAFMITRSLNNYMSERARASHSIGLYSLMQIAGPVIGFGIGIPLLLHGGDGAGSVFIGFIVAQTLGFIVSFWMCDFGRVLGRPDPKILKVAIRFGGAVMAASMLAIVAINVPRFVVGQFLGVASVGIFAAGYGLGLRASSFAVTLVTAGSYPLVVRKMVDEGEAAAFAQLSTNMVLVALVVLPVAFGLLAVNRSVIDLLIAPVYRPATYAVLPLATIGGLFRYLRGHTTDQVFLIKLAPGISTWIAVADLIVAVISTVVGLKLWGLAGAALGPMASGFVTLALSFGLSRYMFGFKAPFVAFAQLTVAAGAMALAIAMLPPSHSPISLAAKIMFGAALYAAFLMAFMPRERRMMVGMVNRRLKRV